jgi:hypothetical protein
MVTPRQQAAMSRALMDPLKKLQLLPVYERPLGPEYETILKPLDGSRT